jgi:hypothetical protein
MHSYMPNVVWRYSSVQWRTFRCIRDIIEPSVNATGQLVRKRKFPALMETTIATAFMKRCTEPAYRIHLFAAHKHTVSNYQNVTHSVRQSNASGSCSQHAMGTNTAGLEVSSGHEPFSVMLPTQGKTNFQRCRRQTVLAYVPNIKAADLTCLHVASLAMSRS